MRNLGIHTRLFLVALFLIAASMMVMVYLGIHTTKRFMVERMEDRMAFLAKYLALNSELGVLIRDTEGLERLSRNLLKEKDVRRVVIMDASGNRLVEVGQEEAHCDCVVEREVLLRRTRPELLFGSMLGPTQRRVEPIGLVRLLYSTSGIDRLMRTITYRYVLSSLAIVILSAVLFYFMSRPLVREVTALAATARQVEKGRLDLRADLGSVPETRELAAAFNSMLDSLEEKREALAKANQEVIRQRALAEMGKFSLMVAHEVKNPLSIIKSSLEILKTDRDIPPEDPMVLYIEDEIQRLNKLIEDFLVFARPSEVKTRRVDLNDVAKEVANRAEYMAPGRNLDLHQDIPEEPCPCEADPEQLTAALWNIVKNAWEATNGEGNIWIKTWRDQGFWVMEVEDDGKGVPDEDRERIFEPFFTTKAKGTGLGLAFASQVIGAHGGGIEVERGKAGGALFRVRIPLKLKRSSHKG